MEAAVEWRRKARVAVEPRRRVDRTHWWRAKTCFNCFQTAPAEATECPACGARFY